MNSRLRHKRHALVLGAGGFLGRSLCAALRGAGESVRGFGRSRPQGDLPEFAGVEWVRGELGDVDCLRHAMTGCDRMYHLISTTIPATSNRDPHGDCASNVLATVKMLDLAVEKGIGKVVFVSSGGTVYGIPEQVPIPETAPTEPICAYGVGKLAIEKYLRLYHLLHGLEYAVLRVSNPYGERQEIGGSLGAVSVFTSKAVRGEVIEIWGDGEVVRDYVHVDDVVLAMHRAMEYQGTMRLFNIGSGEGCSLNQLLELLEELLGRPVSRRYAAARSTDVPINILDVSRAENHLGWRPVVSLRDGLRRLADFHGEVWSGRSGTALP